MNMPLEAVVLANSAPPAKLIAEARSESAASGRRALEIVEERSDLPRNEIVTALAASFGYRPITSGELGKLAAAFDVIPYAEAATHDCVALRDQKQALVLACCDPWSSKLRAWGEERIKSEFMWGLVHPAELTALLSKHEESLGAVESLAPSEEARTDAKSKAEDISLRSISEDASPVVRFVNSTLYDALKSGASDIHF